MPTPNSDHYDDDSRSSPVQHGPVSRRFKSPSLCDRDIGVGTKEAQRFTEIECIIGVDHPSCRSFR